MLTECDKLWCIVGGVIRASENKEMRSKFASGTRLLCGGQFQLHSVGHDI